MSVRMPQPEPPRPVPRKRAVGQSASSPSLTRATSAKDLEVVGLRSKLDEMSMKELRGVLENAATLHELILSLNYPRLKELLDNKESTTSESRRLAQQNVDLKPKLESLRNELASQQTDINNLMDVYMQFYNELTELVKKLDNQKILVQLQESVNQLESETEGVAENFLAAKTNEEQFLSQYMRSRSSYWLRKVKAERMEQLLTPGTPTIPPRRSQQPTKPQPYRGGSVKQGNVEMPVHPRTNTFPSTQRPSQPMPAQQQPYRQPPPPVPAAVQAAPYPQGVPQYRQPQPQYRPAYPQYQPQQQMPPRPPYPQPARPPQYGYPAQPQYRPPAYGYAPQPGYRQPAAPYHYQQPPNRYR